MSWLSRLLGTGQRSATATATAPAAPVGQMVRMLAAAPDEQRQAMLADRLQVFAAQDEVERRSAMRHMLTAGLDLPDDDYRRIAASRLWALRHLEPPQRMALARSHAEILRTLPDQLRQKEQRTMQAVVAALPPEERMQVTTMMQQTGLMPS